MPRNKHFSVILTWITSSKYIETRKYYTATQLFSMFREEVLVFSPTLINTITPLSFTRNLNRATLTLNNTFLKIKNDRQTVAKYVMISSKDGSTFRNHSIRISDRKLLLSRAFTNRDFPNPNAQSHHNIKESSQSLKKSDAILNLKKMDLPVALPFFFGKARAEKMKKENNNDSTFRDVITQHLQTQINKFKSV